MATEENDSRAPEKPKDSVKEKEDAKVSKYLESADPEKGKSERLSIDPRALRRYPFHDTRILLLMHLSCSTRASSHRVYFILKYFLCS
jgi:hypothetical protein